MQRDPDYLDPAVLKRRAAARGGAGAESGRPRVHRVNDTRYELRLADGVSGVSVTDSSSIAVGVDVRNDVKHIVFS